MDVPLPGMGAGRGAGDMGRWACRSCCHLDLSSSLWGPLPAPCRVLEVCSVKRVAPVL